MRDEMFIRGSVPMTKSEVRAVSLSKLELTRTSVLYDVGAGTGSVSVEAAFMVPDGHVFAIERNAEAVRLIRANREKFKAGNLTVTEGTAPEAWKGLPVPTHAFIGGTCGRMEEILLLLTELNPDIRIVINVIALETLARTIHVLKQMGTEAEILSLQLAKADRIGEYHMMKGQNPVYVISFGGDKK